MAHGSLPTRRPGSLFQRANMPKAGAKQAVPEYIFSAPARANGSEAERCPANPRPLAQTPVWPSCRSARRFHPLFALDSGSSPKRGGRGLIWASGRQVRGSGSSIVCVACLFPLANHVQCACILRQPQARKDAAGCGRCAHFVGINCCAAFPHALPAYGIGALCHKCIGQRPEPTSPGCPARVKS